MGISGSQCSFHFLVSGPAIRSRLKIDTQRLLPQPHLSHNFKNGRFPIILRPHYRLSILGSDSAIKVLKSSVGKALPIPSPVLGLLQTSLEHHQSFLSLRRLNSQYVKVKDEKGSPGHQQASTHEHTKLSDVISTASDSNSASIARSDDDQPENEPLNQAREKLNNALRNGDPHGLLSALSDAPGGSKLISSIPGTTFMEILRLLDPKVFLEPYRDPYKDVHPLSTAVMIGRSVEELLEEHTLKLESIIRERIGDREEPTLEEIKILLNISRHARDGPMASRIWDEMQKYGIVPDTVCYNCYFEAICWSRTYDYYERRKLRITDHNIEVRSGLRNPLLNSPLKWNPRQGYAIGEMGLKSHVVGQFETMVKRGVVADRKTFILLMTALSREGDLEGIKSILQRVWNIDVDKVMQSDDQAPVQVNIPSDSPLYPNSELLYTVAHIFGSNSNLPIALRVIDQVSRRYGLTIDQRVWAELLEWAFVLSVPRSMKKNLDERIGQLPLQSVANLWETLISPTYSCKPSMRMYHHYVKNCLYRETLDPVLPLMAAGWQVYEKSLVRYIKLSKNYSKSSLGNLPQQLHTTNSLFLQNLEHKKNMARLEQCRNFLMINQWFKWVLSSQKWYGITDRVVIWERKKLPLMIEEFWYVRTIGHIGYHTATGYVRLFQDELEEAEKPDYDDVWQQNHAVRRKMFNPQLYLRKSRDPGNNIR